MNLSNGHTLRTAQSADGTTIAYHSVGSGPGIVVIHGNASSSADWVPVGELLADSFTLYLVDRRGRGLSGRQRSDHSMRRECEDAIAVLCETGASRLFGHSFGALVAIEAAQFHRVDKLALYEPPVQARATLEALLPDFLAALREEDYVEAYLTLAMGLGVMPDRDRFGWYLNNVIKPDPKAWALLVQLMDATGKEAAIAAAYTLPDGASALAPQVLLLMGGASPEFLQVSGRQFASTYPTCQVVTFEGEGHTAQATAPQALADALRGFFK